MNLLDPNNGLYTDHYEMTMAQSYFLEGRGQVPAVFDYFFRKNPFGGGFVVFAGLADLLEQLQEYRFTRETLDYLRELGFHREFLSYLEAFRFQADVHAVREGEVVFPQEPCIRIDGTMIESQLVETMVLNLVNFQSLIATKAARIKLAAGDKLLLEFGLRRSHGYGGIQASRAAVIGGFGKTSNMFAARHYGLESTGTMAHSWIQSFGDELEAFRSYARLNPDHCILLVDTYNTLQSGLPNAIATGLEMRKEGKELAGIRLDSGDLAYLSKEARKMLDKAGLKEVLIVASNQLDEHVIASLTEQSAPIDAYGVGTSLVTGKGDGALDGVYKLSLIDGKSTLKVSENKLKVSLPGKKSVFRYMDKQGAFYADAICLENEEESGTIYHAYEPEKYFLTKGFHREAILNKVMEKGEILSGPVPVAEIASYAKQRLEKLPPEHRRFMNPHTYKVGISPGLMKSRDELMQRHN